MHSFVQKYTFVIVNMRGSRGGTGGPDPPENLSEVGSCVDVCGIGEGVQKVVFILLL